MLDQYRFGANLMSAINGAIVPSSAQPIADQQGRITTPWQRFCNALVAGAPHIIAVTPSGSPFAYTASMSGSLVISGGTVSARTLTRNVDTIPVASSTIPMANGDVATITYSVAPTINFVPF